MAIEEVKLRSIKPISNSGFFAFFITMLSLLVLLVVVFTSSTLFKEDASTISKVGSGLLIIFAIPLLIGLASFLLSLIFLSLYNLFLRFYGGVGIEIEV